MSERERWIVYPLLAQICACCASTRRAEMVRGASPVIGRRARQIQSNRINR